VDTANSSGSIPTVRATFADGTDPDYLIAENLSLTSPGIGAYDGDIVSISRSANSNTYSAEVHSIMTRLNSEARVFPLTDFLGIQSVWLPASGLEYWTQQCGIFYSKIPGEPIFYQSQYQHYGAWGKGVTRALKSGLFRYSGSENFGAGTRQGRLMNILPRDSAAIVTFPSKSTLTNMGSYPSVLIPDDASGKVMTFGTTVAIEGTGRQGVFTWHMIDPTQKKRSLRVQVDTASGFVLQTSEDGVNFFTRDSIAADGTGEYTFYVGVTTTATATKYSMKVIRPGSVYHGGFGATVTGSNLRGSLALTQVIYRGSNTGSGSAFLYADNFVSLTDGVPTTWPVPQKSITPGIKPTDFLVGFSGNVWEHIKQYCSIYHLDMNYRNGKLTIEPRPKDVTVGASLSQHSIQIQDREKARHVEVVNQRHTATGVTPKVLWKADSVYQVAVGETQEFVIQTDHSIMEVSQPVCVTGISPYPYTQGSGQYVVTGADGYIVSPAYWADQGGSVTCDITENEGEIKIKIKGPDFDSPRAPYRISEGDAGRPALYITGQGVKADPVTLKIPTGNSRAAKDVGTTLDSPFIGNTLQALDAGVRAARAYAVPEVSATVAEPLGHDEVSKLGVVPAGALIRQGGNVLRVVEATQTPSMMNGTVEQHNTIYQLKRSYGTGATIAEMNAYNDGKPIGKVNLKPMKAVQ
jgi:hypothetical protein